MSSTETNNSSSTRRVPRVPAWIILLATVLIYGGVIYVDHRGSAFSKTVYVPWTSEADFARILPPKDPMVELGRQVYSVACGQCHQNSGLGTPGQFPPLAGSEWVLADKPDRIIRIVLNGAQGEMEVLGKKFNNVMVPWRDALDDRKIAAVLTYIRTNPDWGHNASPVKLEEVAKIRKETADKGGPWTATELLAVPVK